MCTKIKILTCLLLCGRFLHAQAPNDANFVPFGGTATAATKSINAGVNYYTGALNLSFPLFAYSGTDGLKLDISLDYVGAGGIKVNEIASPAGVGWFLNAGGVITRSVRGRPDDLDSKGFMYSSSLGDDYRPSATKYYYDSLDTQQDIFQFNINGRSGKFYIGKDKQIVVVPSSKLRVTYAAVTNGPITSFCITTEDGVRYFFNDLEYERINTDVITNEYKSGYNLQNYTTAWHLSYIVAPFGTDTIRFSYNTVYQYDNIGYPQTVYINNVTGNQDFNYSITGGRDRYFKKISSIDLPDKKRVTFLYSPAYKYDGKDSVFDRIKVSDTVFRYGYVFNWFYGELFTLLNGVQFYTPKATKPAYKFMYKGPYLGSYGSPGDTIRNKRDHWGYYNGANNGIKVIPSVPSVYSGANRDPSATANVASALYEITDPLGGITTFTYEANQIRSYSLAEQTFTLGNVLANTTQNGVVLQQSTGAFHTMKVSLPTWVTKLPTNPLSPTSNINFVISTPDGSTNVASFVVNLAQLYNTGATNLTFNAPDGTYKVSTSFLTGTSSSVNPLPLDVAWYNKTPSGPSSLSGGIRVKQILHMDIYTRKIDTIASYEYTLTDGASSGFLGIIPKYDYPFQRTVINGSTTTTNYTAISSDPVNNLHYTQGSVVGYSRVVSYKGTPKHNLGKEVYEFTDLQDANVAISPSNFPYAPTGQREWAIGLPKRISIYDSLGNLIRVTRNTYEFINTSLNVPSFHSLKLGRSSITYSGDPNSSNTSKTEYFTCQRYWPEAGRSNLISTTDTVYHPNGSVQVTMKSIQYDTCYNVVKVTTSYDKTRQLFIEKRMYYPYNYNLSSGTVKKLKDSGIISSLIATEDWITGDANPRMIQATITDYQQLPQGYIRPSVMYSMQSNAPVPLSVIGAFNPSILNRNASWIIAQQNFLAYDSKGNLLESKDAQSGQRSAIIMDYNNLLPVANVSNASYTDVAYTGFESDGTGNWTIASAIRETASCLTGFRSYQLSNGSVSKSGLTATREYLLYLWANSIASITVNGTTIGSPIASRNGWNLFQIDISGVTTVTITGSGLLDEIRLHPKQSKMASSAYEPSVGIVSYADANNTISYYEYDKLGRQSILRDKDRNILKKVEYESSISEVSTTPSWETMTTQCQVPLNGKKDRIERDVNPFSDSYNLTRTVFDGNDCVTCKPTCNTGQKLVNCQCETGVLFVAAALYTKETGVWRWKCTYHYKFSDCSTVFAYTEYKTSACTVGHACD